MLCKHGWVFLQVSFILIFTSKNTAVLHIFPVINCLLYDAQQDQGQTFNFPRIRNPANGNGNSNKR